jgi:hypothetical protein
MQKKKKQARSEATNSQLAVHGDEWNENLRQVYDHDSGENFFLIPKPLDHFATSATFYAFNYTILAF